MNPYESLPTRSFWRTAVAELDPYTMRDLWSPKFTWGLDDPILTLGSCFATNIGPALLERGMNWWDVEPPPPGLTPQAQRAKQYRQFSFRTGNLYTTAMLRQWFAWALGEATPPDEVWCAGGRFFDPFRPSIEPEGFESAEAMLAAREVTLRAIRSGLTGASVLIFTLGLTEAWSDRDTGAIYQSCPGTVRGTFDPTRHALRNFTFFEVYRDLRAAIELAGTVNPALRVLLTVSPVPLTATATGAHVLPVGLCAKAVLRAVAGQLATERDDVDYFPSYELIAGFPTKARFYEPNLRTVTAEGVSLVMRHFFDGMRGPAGGSVPGSGAGRVDGGDVLCDDDILDTFHTG